jgi:hypothetical protein
VILNLNEALGILISALGEAAVGLGRELSGHAVGPKARFAGIRTFTLLGLLAGLAGRFWSNEQHMLAIVLIGGLCRGQPTGRGQDDRDKRCQQESPIGHDDPPPSAC